MMAEEEKKVNYSETDTGSVTLMAGDAYDAPPQSSTRVCRIIGGLGLLCLSMILIIVLCVVLIEPLEKPLPDRITYAPTTTLPPKMSARFEEVMEFLKANGISTSAANTTNYNSVEQRAAMWIADYDMRQVPMFPDENAFIQRYVLAVFYYSVNGDATFPADIGFLSKEHECDWNKQEFYEAKNMTRTIGTQCNDKMQINGLFFPHQMITGSFPSELDILHELAAVDVYY